MPSDATNYGHIGAVVGHELTHGFDDQGASSTRNGNLHDWWTPEDKKQFEERTGCVDNEYSQFTAVDDVKVNGKLTLGENIADNGGARIAFMAHDGPPRGFWNAACLHARAGCGKILFSAAAVLPRLRPELVHATSVRNFFVCSPTSIPIPPMRCGCAVSL